MATRRPTDDGEDEDESTALDLGRDIAAAVKNPPPGRQRPAEPPRAPPPGGRSGKPPAAPPPGQHAPDDDDTDYLTERPSSVSRGGQRPVESRDTRDARGSQEQADEDATEFLAERPTGQSLSLKAISQVGPEREMRGLSPSRRAVPLGEERSAPRAPAPAAAEPPRAPSPHRGAHRPVAHDEEDEVTEPPAVRAARAVAEPDDDATDAPRSMPRVTRFFVAAAPRAAKPKSFDVVSQTDPGDDDSSAEDGAEDGAGDGADRGSTAPPQTQHRPLPPRADMSAAPLRPVTIIATPGPNPFKRESTLSRSAGPTTGVTTTNQTAEADSAPADGLLVIEVPEGAVVFVDGEDCGTGPQVRVENLHRYERHTIKVHASGYLRWTGSVSLEGRTAAKVRPALKKK